MNPRLFLIDFSSLIFRAYYAFPPLTGPAGQPVQAIYGMAVLLMRWIEKVQPSDLGGVWDSAQGSEFRKRLYPAYKAHRKEPPADLIPQFSEIERLVRCLRIPSIRVSGVEADDLLAAWLQEWLEQHPAREAVIVSGDKDFLQLVSDRVQVWDPQKETRWDPSAVFQKWGVWPHQMRDYLALVGDASDGIPGVASVGPKTAVQWLKEYGTLEALLEAVEKRGVTFKKSDVLKRAADQARLSQQLVAFEDLSSRALTFPSSAFELRASQELLHFFQEFRFDSLLKKLGAESVGEMPSSPSEQSAPSFVFKRFQSWKEVLGEWEARGVIASEEAWLVKCTAGGFLGSWGPEEVWQLPPLSPVDRVFWQPFFQTPLWKSGRGWGLKDFRTAWERAGGEGEGPELEDLSLKAYLIDSGREVSLSSLLSRYGLERDVNLSSEGGEWLACLRLKEFLDQEFEALPETSRQLLSLLDRPFLTVLSRMEAWGVLLKLEVLEHWSREFGRALSALSTQILSYSKNDSLNLQSPKQVATFLFEELGLQLSEFHKAGTTDFDALQALRSQHPVIDQILEYREIAKLKSTYTDALGAFRDSETGRVHSVLNPFGTATGRISSAHPNLQNIPKKTARGLAIREAFQAQPGWIFGSADYSQIELRILAHFSADERLLEAFQRDADVHSQTAADLFHKPLEQVTVDERRIAKAINFGLIYGKSAFGLAQELGLTRGEAVAFREAYFQRYPRVREYLETQVQKAQSEGWVETLWGRRRYLKKALKGAARQAMNSPIQGTAADFMKRALVDLDCFLQKHRFRSRIWLQVHDEVLLECPEEELPTIRLRVKEILEQPMGLRVPLKVHWSEGKTWKDLEKI